MAKTLLYKYTVAICRSTSWLSNNNNNNNNDDDDDDEEEDISLGNPARHSGFQWGPQNCVGFRILLIILY